MPSRGSNGNPTLALERHRRHHDHRSVVGRQCIGGGLVDDARTIQPRPGERPTDRSIRGQASRDHGRPPAGPHQRLYAHTQFAPLRPISGQLLSRGTLRRRAGGAAVWRVALPLPTLLGALRRVGPALRRLELEFSRRAGRGRLGDVAIWSCGLGWCGIGWRSLRSSGAYTSSARSAAALALSRTDAVGRRHTARFTVDRLFGCVGSATRRSRRPHPGPELPVGSSNPARPFRPTGRSADPVPRRWRHALPGGSVLRWLLPGLSPIELWRMRGRPRHATRRL